MQVLGVHRLEEIVRGRVITTPYVPAGCVTLDRVPECVQRNTFKGRYYDPRWTTHGVFEFAPTLDRASRCST